MTARPPAQPADGERKFASHLTRIDASSACGRETELPVGWVTAVSRLSKVQTF